MKNRKEEITTIYFRLMHEHLEDVKAGRSKVLGLKDISERMHIQARHLSNTVKAVTGKSPCHFFEEALIQLSKELLGNHKYKICELAFMLDYDPSNFTKFFKHYTGQTPSQYQQSISKY
jgi:AraC-like DNA-binding protein